MDASQNISSILYMSEIRISLTIISIGNFSYQRVDMQIYISCFIEKFYFKEDYF